MRILMTTLGGEGHLRPLLPFADAFRDLGHDVLIAIPESAAERVDEAGHDAWELADPPEVESIFSRANAAASADEANAIVIGEVFAGVYARASLPGVMAATAEWLPDVLMHETCEFAAALTAERAGMASVRVAVHMRELESYIARMAAPAVDELRAEHGLAPDPRGERLSAGPSVTLTPPALDGRRDTHYRELRPALAPPPGRWDGDDRPLVYLSYGTIAPKGDAYPSAYEEAIEQLAGLDVRVLLNTGRQDPAALGSLPAGVHAERWVHEAAVLPHVAAMISHGGAGSVRTALSAGVPLAVVPRFGDQPLNARAVEAAGAGLVVADAGRLRSTVAAVLEDRAYRHRAAEIAAEVAALPPVAESIGVVAQIAESTSEAARSPVKTAPFR
jgi:UDP:flavonoid glycosyltransferase YjiC (YdhE family)